MSAEPVALTERLSMIRPVALGELNALGDLPSALQLGQIKLIRKAELHYTVFNYKIGQALKDACATDPTLHARIDAEAAAFSWTLQPGRVFQHLVRDTLHTVVVMVDAPLAEFYQRTSRLLAGDAPEAVRSALLLPPPPHVTLYTSDPAGKAGIALNTVSEMQDAQARVLDEHAPGLRAYRLHPGLIAEKQRPILE